MNQASLLAPAADADAYPELLRDLADLVASKLVEAGIERERAAAVGETVIEEISVLHGGRQFYLAKNCSVKARRRWLQLWEDFTGRNQAELSATYGMNIKQVYRVLAIVREEKRRAGPDLFSAVADESKALQVGLDN